jgi:hypothetical protein
MAEGLSPLGIQEVHHEVGFVSHGVQVLSQRVEELFGCVDIINQRTEEMAKVVDRLAGQPSTASTRGEDVERLAGQPSTASVAQFDLSRISEILSQHTQAIHAEMARQCKELARLQERCLQNHHLRMTQQASDVLGTSGQSAPSLPAFGIAEKDRFATGDFGRPESGDLTAGDDPDRHATFATFGSTSLFPDDNQAQSLSETMDRVNSLQSRLAACHSSPHSSFTIAAEAAARRLGLTPSRSARQQASDAVPWPAGEDVTKPAQSGRAGSPAQSGRAANALIGDVLEYEEVK